MAGFEPGFLKGCDVHCTKGLSKTVKGNIFIIPEILSCKKLLGLNNTTSLMKTWVHTSR
jgi:hypothetical protein